MLWIWNYHENGFFLVIESNRYRFDSVFFLIANNLNLLFFFLCFSKMYNQLVSFQMESFFFLLSKAMDLLTYIHLTNTHKFTNQPTNHTHISIEYICLTCPNLFFFVDRWSIIVDFFGLLLCKNRGFFLLLRLHLVRRSSPMNDCQWMNEFGTNTLNFHLLLRFFFSFFLFDCPNLWLLTISFSFSYFDKSLVIVCIRFIRIKKIVRSNNHLVCVDELEWFSFFIAVSENVTHNNQFHRNRKQHTHTHTHTHTHSLIDSKFFLKWIAHFFVVAKLESPYISYLCCQSCCCFVPRFD